MRESLDTFLGALESEDLIAKDRALRDLEAHPGWAVLTELVELQAQKATGQLVQRPMPNVQSYAHAAGHIQGLTRFRDIIEKVHDTTRAVVKSLEANSAPRS